MLLSLSLVILRHFPQMVLQKDKESSIRVQNKQKGGGGSDKN